MVAMLCLASRVNAQVPPFFGGGVVAFDPEVSVLQSGVLTDVQPLVSDDRKYVTLNMRATNARVQQLLPFVVNSVSNPQIGLGFVGGIQLPAGTASAATQMMAGGTTSAASLGISSPDRINRESKAWVFTRSGMYLIKPLK